MTITDRTIVDAERAWHELRAERFGKLSEPYSVLAQSGLHWLTESPQRITDLPGRWYVDGGRAALIADEGDSLRRPVTEELIIGTVRLAVPEAGAALFAEFGPLGEGAKRIELIKRTGSYALRIYDPAAVARQEFRGVPAYPFDPAWVVRASFTEYVTPRSITVPGAQTGLEHHREAIGEVWFERDGAEHRLVVFGDHGTSILFSDVTSGAETAPWRILPIELGDPTAGGPADVLLDFNRAVNLPYAFNDFGTCPQPPEDNRIELAVTAGEQAPYRVDLEPALTPVAEEPGIGADAA
ncbi:DUF1684 domain-containing protein [Microlunatus soli]|uniref:DUF1684 domain-containing protein n=1 Tax=Microlunatus soli TaxID=630515 RepID=A0A1H1PKJ8_9ACTN|nr:DUF1684 domain-containing protein [Microlunatus soli]SDS11249.1 hypothetical protein SAMN04489812_0920 [Microlunatus soli]